MGLFDACSQVPAENPSTPAPTTEMTLAPTVGTTPSQLATETTAVPNAETAPVGEK